MALDIGDATLHFLGDTTQLDQAFERVNAGAAESITPAAAQVEGLGAAFTQTGAQATTAGAQVAATAIELKAAQAELRSTLAAVTAEGGQTAANMDLLAQAETRVTLAAAAAKDAQAALRTELLGQAQASGMAAMVAEEFNSKLMGMLGLFALFETAKGFVEGVQQRILHLRLLSETTGINITTLAGLEHVTQETGVSFEIVSTSLVRLSRAQQLAIEGHKQQITAFERIGISVSELRKLSPEELFYRVGEALANAKTHGDQTASSFTLLGKGGSALIPIFTENREKLKELVDEAGRASGMNDKASDAAANLERQTANLSQTFRVAAIPAMEAAVPAMRGVEAGAALIWEAFMDIATVLVGVGKLFVDDVPGWGKILDDVLHGNLAKATADAKVMSGTIRSDLSGIFDQLKQNFKDTADFEKKVWTDAPPYKGLRDGQKGAEDGAKDTTAELIAQAKAATEGQIAEIDKWKAGQHVAYEAGKIDAASWAVAQIQAADAADVAHEHYLERIIAIYTKAGETLKAHTAQLELNALHDKNAAKENEDLANAIKKHREEVHKVIDAYHQLLEMNVEKEWNANTKAAEQLTKAEEQLTKAQTALAEVNLTKHFRDQEQAINELAQFHLISEEQKSHRLELLYQQEETTALNVLKDQLAKEKAVIDAAQKDLTYAKANPFNFTDAQVKELEKNLVQAQIAYTHTQTEIEKTQDAFDKKMLALDKSRYGQALVLAVASGKQLLAAQLQENHAALLSAQAQLADAKARGINTQAMKDQVKGLETLIKELQKEEKELTNDAKQGLSAWKQFSQGLRDESAKNVKSLEEMGQEMRQDLQSFTQYLGEAFAAVMTGQESFGQAMIHMTEKMIGQMAQQWGEYFAAKGIADIFFDPPLGAAELAAAVALFTLGAAMASLGSGTGGGGGGGSSSHTGTNASPGSTQSGQAQPQPQQIVNVQHFEAGGLITSPTLAVVGDARGGGGAAEAVIPLNDDRAIAAIGARIAQYSGGRAAVVNINVEGVISADNLHEVVRKISRDVNAGKVRLLSSNSIRLTRRS